jgi:hypothetical protein
MTPKNWANIPAFAHCCPKTKLNIDGANKIIIKKGNMPIKLSALKVFTKISLQLP